jgi:hypothetical protein
MVDAVPITSRRGSRRRNDQQYQLLGAGDANDSLSGSVTIIWDRLSLDTRSGRVQ